MEVKILHLSDLHFGSPLHSEKLEANILSYTEKVKPDAIVITGDLTEDGYPHEYEAAVKFIDKLKTELKLIVPGNHDARNMGYALFEEIFKNRYPTLEVGPIKIQGVDSSEPDLDDGRIGRLAYEIVKSSLKDYGGIRAVALHHHLIPIPGTGRERNIPVDTGDFLHLLDELDIHIVFSGHKHVPWIWVLNDIVILNAGTSTSLRVKARTPPSMNLVKIDSKGLVEVEKICTLDLTSKPIYKAYLRGKHPS